MTTRDIAAVRNREKWRTEFGLVDAATPQIEAFATTLEVPIGDARRVVIVTLLLRACYALEAIALLATRGYFTEARAQFRGLIEATIKLAALQAKPELLSEYQIQDELFRRRMFKDILAMRRDRPDASKAPSDEEVSALLAECVARIKVYQEEKNCEKPLRDISLVQWAKHARLEIFLGGHYPMASDALHHGPRDLERRFHVVDGELEGIVTGPEPGDVGNLLIVASQFAFVAVESCALAFEEEIPVGICSLFDELKRLSGGGASDARATADAFSKEPSGDDANR